jgi:lipid II:glycine glycyltransferase (peptidoglycan interpeptide bridge formation enzyme)
MAIITSDEARDLSDNFYELAKETGDFRHDNLNILSASDKQKLDDSISSMLDYGQNMLVLSTILVKDEVKESLEQINKITSEIKGNIKKLQNIQKGIDLTTAIVTLGIAIISNNPKSVISALKGLGTSWEEVKKDIPNENATVNL